MGLAHNWYQPLIRPDPWRRDDLSTTGFLAIGDLEHEQKYMYHCVNSVKSSCCETFFVVAFFLYYLKAAAIMHALTIKAWYEGAQDSADDCGNGAA